MKEPLYISKADWMTLTPSQMMSVIKIDREFYEASYRQYVAELARQSFRVIESPKNL